MGKFEEAGPVLWVRWKCEVPALRLKLLCRGDLGPLGQGNKGITVGLGSS